MRDTNRRLRALEDRGAAQGLSRAAQLVAEALGVDPDLTWVGTEEQAKYWAEFEARMDAMYPDRHTRRPEGLTQEWVAAALAAPEGGRWVRRSGGTTDALGAEQEKL